MTAGEALVLLAGLWLLATRASSDAPAGLTWPVPAWVDAWGRVDPVVSQAVRSGRHAGLDILYRTAEGYMAPEGTPIVAASTGIVERVVHSARGWGVVIDHQDNRFKTFYQHLEAVDVKRNERVTAGQRIGTMGIDPLDPQRVRHLHFEVWTWAGNRPVDPMDKIDTWRKVTWRQ